MSSRRPAALITLLLLLAASSCVSASGKSPRRHWGCSSKLWKCPDDCYCSGSSRCVPKEPKCKGGLRNYDCTSSDSFCLGGKSMRCAPGTWCGANRGSGSPCYLTSPPKRCHEPNWKCIGTKHVCLSGHVVRCPHGARCHGWGPCVLPVH